VSSQLTPGENASVTLQPSPENIPILTKPTLALSVFSAFLCVLCVNAPMAALGGRCFSENRGWAILSAVEERCDLPLWKGQARQTN